jgi:putative FmdB family regulatory protein
MPLYEYLCESCGERLERLQKMGAPPLVDCPACGEPRLRRLLSAPSFQFKGSGWYVTDYGRGGKEPGGASGKDQAKEGGSESAKEGGSGTAAGQEEGGREKAAKGGEKESSKAKAEPTD